MNKPITILILLNLMLISLTGIFSLNKLDLFFKQSLFWLIGFLLFFSYLFIDYRFIFNKYFVYLILLFSFLILILVLFTPGYPKSWFNIFGFYLQPSEFTKLGFFIVMTIFLSRYKLDLVNFLYLILSLIIVLPFIFLILFQPDWGMAFLYVLIWFLVIVSFLSKKEIIYALIISICDFSFLWFFILKDYQKERILIFFKPEIDPLKTGYNLRQIKLSLSTSSFFGKGVGLGEIGRLGFLPSAHTDFIITFLIEERGIFIFIIYSLLIFLLNYEIIKTQKFQKNPLIKNFIFIISQYFLAKYIITTLVNFGIFPIIGLPVPFLSYGGSHLVFDLWLLGMLMSLTKEKFIL